MRMCFVIQDESGIHGGFFFRFGSFRTMTLETVMPTDHAHGPPGLAERRKSRGTGRILPFEDTILSIIDLDRPAQALRNAES